MIVYNCERRWFEKQDEANAYRRTLLKPRSWPVTRVRVEGREDLAHLLNALCGASTSRVDVVLPQGPVLPTQAAERVTVSAYAGKPDEVPDYIPLFLLDPDRRKQVQADREARGWKEDQ